MTTGAVKPILEVRRSDEHQRNVALDATTRRILRLLGEAAIRIADGERAELSVLHSHLTEAEGRLTMRGQHTSELLTITEACDRLRISRWSFYRLLHDRQLTTVTIGRRRFVSPNEIHRFATNLAGVGSRV